MIKLKTNIFDEVNIDATEVVVKIVTKSDTKGLEDAEKKTKSLSDTVKSTGKSISNNLGKMFSAVGITASIAGITKSIKKAVTDAASYEESLNLFHMALGKYYQDGMAWSKKIADALYLDDSEILQYTGSFFNLAKGLGASSDAAYLMSKNLTQLTYDMSSYLNIDVSSANAKLMSAMSGQTKAVTSVGIAVQSASLQELAYSMGIKKSIRDMTQAEKTYLRYIQIMRSTKQMQGDLARTIITPTNAFRMLSTQVTLLGRAIGQVLTPIIYKVMPILIALTHVLTEAAKKLAAFFGYEIQDIDYSSVEGLTDNIKGLGKEVDKTAAKARRMLAPFDELNVVEAASGGKGGGVGGSVLDQLEKELKGYDMLEGLNEKMQDSIKQWEERIRGLGPVILGVAGIVAGLKIFSFLGKVSKGITSILELGGLIGTDLLAGLTTAFLTIGSVLLSLGVTISSCMKGYSIAVNDNLSTTEKVLGSVIVGLTGVAASAGIAFVAFGSPVAAAVAGLVTLAAYVASVQAGLDKWVENQAVAELNRQLGAVNISTEQWMQTLMGSDSELAAIIQKIDSFNESIKSNSDQFTAASEKAQGDILLYSSSVGQYATISKDMLTTIVGDMNSMAESSSAGIKDYVDKNLALMQDQYNNATGIEKEQLGLQMQLLAKHGNDAKKQVSSSKQAIIDIYTKASKEHRQLTDKELTQVKNHLNKMSTAYTQFTGEAGDDMSKFFDDQGKLRDGYSYDTIVNFIEAKDKYLAKVKQYADQEYDESKKYWDKLKSQGKIDNDEYNRMMENAEKTRQDKLTAANKTVAKYTEGMRDQLIDVYKSLEGKTDSVSFEMRKKLENAFKDLKLDGKAMCTSVENALGGMKSAAVKSADSFADAYNKEAVKRFNKAQFVSEVKMVTSSDGKTITMTPKTKLVYAKADGGYLDRGDLFIANEAGPEYITSIGNKSAVVNQGQMIAALSDAIVTAVGGKVNGNKQPNVVVYVGDKKLYEGQGEYQDRQNDRYGSTVVRI